MRRAPASPPEYSCQDLVAPGSSTLVSAATFLCLCNLRNLWNLRRSAKAPAHRNQAGRLRHSRYAQQHHGVRQEKSGSSGPTDRDYTSLVGIAAPVTVWYKAEGGVNHLEDIVYPPERIIRPG